MRSATTVAVPAADCLQAVQPAREPEPARVTEQAQASAQLAEH
jgi:hypothetical protein